MMNTNAAIMTVIEREGNHFFVCPCRDCNDNDEGMIPRYYSFEHARDSGWVFTDHIKYSHDGELVAVCPSCAKKEKWRLLK